MKIVAFYAKGISVPTSVWAWNPKDLFIIFKNTPSEIFPLHCDDGMHFSVSCSFGKKKYMASRFWIAYFLLSGSDENWSKASSILSRRWWIRPQLKIMSLELRSQYVHQLRIFIEFNLILEQYQGWRKFWKSWGASRNLVGIIYSPN